jgi:LmbE family N-acetylglucosaminyl deacetylase
MDQAATRPLREEEKRRGAAIADVSEMGSPAITTGRRSLAECGIPLRRGLEAAFRRLQPEVVITMSLDLTWGEERPVNHADHHAAGLAGLGACRDAANERVFPGAAMPDHQGRLCGGQRQSRSCCPESEAAPTIVVPGLAGILTARAGDAQNHAGRH